jgi:hypothetical protein
MVFLAAKLLRRDLGNETGNAKPALALAETPAGRVDRNAADR